MCRKYQINIIVVVLLAVFVFLAVSSIWPDRKSPTCDELSHHIPVGYVFLIKRDFAFATDSPPLARCFAALPLLGLNINLPDERSFWAREDRGEFSKEFMYKLNRSIADKIVRYARLPNILLASFGGIFLFFWIRKKFDLIAAVLASFFYFLSPNILAHARLATTDIAATVFIMCSVFTFWDLVNKPGRVKALIAGVFMGLAMMSKYSALLLFPVYAVLTVSIYSRQLTSAKRLKTPILSSFFLFLCISFFVLWAGYAFEFKPFLKDVLRPEGKIEIFENVIRRIYPAAGVEFLDRAKSWLYTVPVPLSSFFLGVLGVLKHASGSMGTFFMGYRSSGHPMYYVLVFLIKTPIPVIISFFLGTLILFRRTEKRALHVYLLSVMLIYFIMASRSDLQLGLRYVLPVYPIIFVIASIGLTDLFAKRRVFKAVGFGLILWSCVIPLYVWPDYLSYFNESIGGPGNGYKYLRGSNLSWGQDLPALREYMKDNSLEDVVLVYHGSADPSYYGIGYSKISDAEVFSPEKKVYAISAHSFDSVEWTKDHTPVKKIGYSIFIYDFRDSTM